MEKDDNIINLADYKGRGRTKKDHDRLRAIKEIANEMENEEIRQILLICLRDAWMIDLASS